MGVRKITLSYAEHKLSAEWLAPKKGLQGTFVLAHGAGAGMNHPFLVSLSQLLYNEKIATLRFNFPFMEARSKRPDRPVVAQQALRAAVEFAVTKGKPLLLGGKSFGGRMASHLATDHTLPIDGLVYVGFPLHPPAKPSVVRATHLADVPFPQLFLQGTRDKLAELNLIRKTVTKLPRATLKIIQDADHGFAVLKRSGRTESDVLTELTTEIKDWARTLG